MTQPVLILTGPTAAGKTPLALALAQRDDLEIVSMDSMQVYRGMDVGTAKPTALERARVSHHGLDLVGPLESYDVARWLADTQEALADIEARGKRALLVGGTGFFLQAFLRGLFRGPAPNRELRAALEARAASEGSPALHHELRERDPLSAARIHPNDKKRVVRALEVLEGTGRALSEWQAEWGWHGSSQPERAHRLVVLDLERERLDERIEARTRAMLEGGWPQEVEGILAAGGFGPSAIQALGYPEVIAFLQALATKEQTQEVIARRTRRFARRQNTWFQRFPKALRIQADAADLQERVREHLFSSRT